MSEEMKYKIIDLKTPGKDEIYVKRVLDQYQDICKSVPVTRSLKKIRVFGAQMQELDGNVSSLNKKPLARLYPVGIGPYAVSNNIIVICLDAKDTIMGFLAGVVDVTKLMAHDDYYSGPDHRDQQLNSYDRNKYNALYDYFVPEGPMAWIEIICVQEAGRGKGIAKQLIDEFIDYSAQGEEIVIGLDIAGTVEGGINLGLKKIYEGLGFEFPVIENKNFYRMFGGSQIAGRRY